MSSSKNKLIGTQLHLSDDWKTPKKLYDYFINKCKCIDPCPYKCEYDNLNKQFDGNLFINPPYSKLNKWIDFIENHQLNTIYLLIPVRTDTEYFHKLMKLQNRNIKLYFLKGRLHFNDEKGSAPFPSVIIKIEPSIIKSFQLYFITQDEIELYIY